MGQQQLLLIVVGVIIVGLAVVFGMRVFREHALESKRNNLIQESYTLGAIAQSYYHKPQMLGGGGNSFENWQIPKELESTSSGDYEAEVSFNTVEIVGIGNEIVTGTDYVKVKTTVTVSSIFTEVLN